MIDDAVQPCDLRRARQAETAAWAVVVMAVTMIVAVIAATMLVRG